MKTKSEVKDKIIALHKKFKKAKSSGEYYLAERIACQIDGLLWVLGDTSDLGINVSAMPTFDERSDYR